MENYIINLDVGGTVYRTNKSALKESQYFNNLLEKNELNKERLFIDRDGLLFRYILLYLRTGELDVDKQYQKSLRNEAEFYKIPKLVSIVYTMIGEDQPKEPVFKLLNQQEFISFSNIDVSCLDGGLPVRTAVDPSGKFVTSIRCNVTSYNCSREIYAHKEPKNCGKACHRAKGYGYVKISSKETYMYLISITP